MEKYGFLWKFEEKYGNLRKNMEKIWKFMEKYGILWKNMETKASPNNPLGSPMTNKAYANV